MGETSNEIKQQIDHKRDALGENLDQIQRKVKDAADWRIQVQKRPFTMIGVAFGGGLLLAQMIGNGNQRRRSYLRTSNGHEDDRQTASPATHIQMKKAADTWDKIKGALVGVGATKFREFLGDVVPGFHEEYRKVEEERPPIASTSTLGTEETYR